MGWKGSCHTDFTVGLLVIECDGDYWHNKKGAAEKDGRKTINLTDRGYTVLRFTETDLINNLDECKKGILWKIHQQQSNLV